MSTAEKLCFIARVQNDWQKTYERSCVSKVRSECGLICSAGEVLTALPAVCVVYANALGASVLSGVVLTHRQNQIQMQMFPNEKMFHGPSRQRGQPYDLQTFFFLRLSRMPFTCECLRASFLLPQEALLSAPFSKSSQGLTKDSGSQWQPQNIL